MRRGNEQEGKLRKGGNRWQKREEGNDKERADNRLSLKGNN